MNKFAKTKLDPKLRQELIVDDFSKEMRPRQVVDKTVNSVIAFFIFLFSLVVYWLTQNRSVTFWDVGEYISSSSILGIPHPPGNPFYILLGRVCTILGFNLPHALVINSLSGLMAALAVMFVYLFTVKFISMIEDNRWVVYVGAVIAALYTAFSFSFWNNAIEGSVYPGRDLVINLIIWLTLVWIEKTKDFSHLSILLLIVYIFFLGFGIHQTCLQILPAVLLIVIYPMIVNNFKTNRFWLYFGIYLVVGLVVYLVFIEAGKKMHIPDMGKIVTGIFFCLITYLRLQKKIPLKVWLWGVVFILIALSSHIFLLVRSELRPFINEGHPHTISLFSDYVLRRQYGVVSFLVRRAKFLYQIDYHFMRYFFWQFFNADTISSWTNVSVLVMSALSKTIVLLLGIAGMIFQFKKNRHSFIYLLSFFLMTSLAMVFVMNLSDAEVRDRDYFFVSAYYLWGVWMAIGSVGIARYLSNKSGKPVLIVILALLFTLPILNLASQYHIHDRSKEFVALDYGVNFLNSLEENAIVFTNGDNDTFPLWYAQAVKDPHAKEYIHPAKDVYPTDEDKVRLRKAVENKKKHIHGIRPDVTVANLSLLNTSWYIRHLRDTEGVRFDIPDDKIDLLTPFRVDKDYNMTFCSPKKEYCIDVNLPKDYVFLLNQVSVFQIVRDNFGIRPIYFAVTVPDNEIFVKNLRNEGMVSRIISEKGSDMVDIERLMLNIDEIYEYRSIFDDSVYKDENIWKLITNYGAAYMRASQYYNAKGDLKKSGVCLEKAISFIRNSERFYPGLIQLYIDAEEYQRALSFIDKLRAKEPNSIDLYFQAVMVHLENNDVDSAFDEFERAIDNKLYDKDLVSFINIAAQEHNQIDRGIALLEKCKPLDKEGIIPNYIEALKHIKDNKLESIN